MSKPWADVNKPTQESPMHWSMWRPICSIDNLCPMHKLSFFIKARTHSITATASIRRRAGAMAWLRRQVMGCRPRAKKYNNCKTIHTDAAIPEKANFGSFALGKLLVNIFSQTHSTICLFKDYSNQPGNVNECVWVKKQDYVQHTP